LAKQQPEQIAPEGNPVMSTHPTVIKHKVGLLRLAEELGNVSQACKVMGYSRDTFYRYRQAVDEGGVEALIDKSRRKPNLRNRTAPEIEEAIVTLAVEEPALGQVRVSNELRKRGLTISPAGVRGVWQRHELETFKKRLVALERKVAEEGVILTEGQLAALERQRHDDEATGEIETEHPGYLGSQDTFYVGTLKGVGRIYQQAFVDTYSKWAAAKLYPAKTAITAADLLNDRVLPFFEAQGAVVLRLLTRLGEHLKTGHLSTGQNRPFRRRDRDCGVLLRQPLRAQGRADLGSPTLGSAFEHVRVM
jgi:hypothetical protein